MRPNPNQGTKFCVALYIQERTFPLYIYIIYIYIQIFHSQKALYTKVQSLAQPANPTITLLFFLVSNDINISVELFANVQLSLLFIFVQDSALLAPLFSCSYIYLICWRELCIFLIAMDAHLTGGHTGHQFCKFIYMIVTDIEMEGCMEKQKYVSTKNLLILINFLKQSGYLFIQIRI